MNRNRKGIHQIVAGFVDGDAISNLAIRLQTVFHGWGYESEIFCPLRHISPKMRGRARVLEEHRSHSHHGNIVVFHFSIGSETIDYFKTLPDKKVLVYHNITPGHYYRAIYDERETLLNQGREELRALAAVPDLTLADSAFNAEDLRQAGYKNVQVMPIIIDLDRLDRRPDQGIVNRYSDGVKNILFVGRIVPNKRFEDIIQAFYVYRLSTHRQARLLLVGTYIELERYLAYLKNLVPYYHVADLFLCMSEHEGFCIPLLESMHFRVPILAYAAGAVPETLKGSGVLVTEKDYLKIAEMMDMLLNDEGLRARVISTQSERLKDFNHASLEDKLKGYLAPWLPS